MSEPLKLCSILTSFRTTSANFSLGLAPFTHIIYATAVYLQSASL